MTIKVPGSAPAQDTASVMLGMDGVMVTEAEREAGGRLSVWAKVTAPAACPGCGTVSETVHQYVVTAPRDVRICGEHADLFLVRRRMECPVPSGAPTLVNVFQDDQALQLINTPDKHVTRVPISYQLPPSWLAAGALNRSDVSAAAYFRQLLQTRQANVPFVVIPGGGHQASVWRAALDPILSWMTPQLAEQAEKADTGSRSGRRYRRPVKRTPG